MSGDASKTGFSVVWRGGFPGTGSRGVLQPPVDSGEKRRAIFLDIRKPQDGK